MDSREGQLMVYAKGANLTVAGFPSLCGIDPINEGMDDASTLSNLRALLCSEQCQGI